MSDTVNDVGFWFVMSLALLGYFAVMTVIIRMDKEKERKYTPGKWYLKIQPAYNRNQIAIVARLANENGYLEDKLIYEEIPLNSPNFQERKDRAVAQAEANINELNSTIEIYDARSY